MNKAVFLDRDGVINRAIVRDGFPYAPSNINLLELLPGVPNALKELKDSGWLLIVITNQPDVARGKVSKLNVEVINDYLLQNLPIHEIKVCYHDTIDRCQCRKPLPGLIIEAANQYNINLYESYMVGDRWRDIDAGASAGCKTIFIDYNYVEKRPQSYTHSVKSLAEASVIILGNKNEKS